MCCDEGMLVDMGRPVRFIDDIVYKTRGWLVSQRLLHLFTGSLLVTTTIWGMFNDAQMN